MRNKDKVVVITSIVAIPAILWLLVLPLFIGSATFKNELQSSFESATGMQLEIQGDVALTMLPLPHFTAASLYVINMPGGKAPFLLTVKNAQIWPNLSSLFKGHKGIRRIQASDMTVNVEALENGRMNWQEVSSHWKSSASQALPTAMFDRFSFEVTGATLSYMNVAGAVHTLDHVTIAVDIDAQAQKASMDAKFSYQSHPFTISTKASGTVAQFFSSDLADVTLQATNDKNALYYNGKLGYKDNRPLANGDLKIETDDITFLAQLYNGDLADVAAPASRTKLPFSLSTKMVTQDEKKISFPDIMLGGETVKGRAQAELLFPSQITVKAALSQLNLQSILENGYFVRPRAGRQEANKNYLTARPDSGLAIAATIKIDDVLYNGKHINNATFSAEIAGEDLTVPQLLASLPGESQLSFSGIGKSSGASGLSLEGQVDIQGNNFIDAVSLFSSGVLKLPPADFRRFHMRANTLISSRELRLSELAARIEDIGLNGGLSAKFTERTNLQMALGISNANLDHILSAWGMESWQRFLWFDDKIKNNDGVLPLWLKSLSYDVQASISLDNYLLNSQRYDKANFSLAATAGKAQLDLNKTSYSGSVLSGKVMMDVTKPVPQVSVQGDIDKFDPDVFFAKAGKSASAVPVNGKQRWSEDIIDFSWLGNVSGTFDLKLGQFRHKALEAGNVNMSGGIDERKLSIDSFKASVLGANVIGKGTITGGAIPAVSAAFTVESLKVENIAPMLPLLQGASGLVNASAQLSTNGVNVRSLISNLQGRIAASGQNIGVHGFNLSGIIKAVNYVRTVADILNVVKRAFPNGNSIFPAASGEWVVSKGIFETFNMKVSNELADGVIASRIDLANWQTAMKANFALKALDPVNTPSMTINMSGDLDSPAIDIDIHSLEQYVNNKTSEKMMQQYGGQH
jgi:uncharacterized protein involved in outer membrane biogenesis